MTTSFEKDGYTRVAIASSALSMGVDFPNVKYVILFGPSKSLTSYLQEAGRAGCDGSDAFNIIMYLPKHLKNCEKQVKHAIKSGEKSCVRQALLSSFDKDIEPFEPLHNCCSTCHRQCKCNENMCNVPLFKFDEPFIQDNVQVTDIRSASEDEKECLKNALEELQKTLQVQSSMPVLSFNGMHLFGLDGNTIETIVVNVNNISGISELQKYCPFSSMKLLLMVLEVMSEIFDDVIVPDELYHTSLETHSLMNELIANLKVDESLSENASNEASLDESFHLSEEWL